MPRDLRDMLDNIESSENQSAALQAKVDKLTTLAGRQKRIISEQEGIIQEQKEKISKMSDIPEDILELKELIGTQRQLLNERALELEYAKGEVAQSQRELELMKKQIIPTQHKIEEAYETMGNLRTEMAEKSSELILKNEAVKNLNNKIEELQAFTDKFKEEQVKLIAQLEGKRRKESQVLKAEITKLDSIILDSKLTSTEKDSEAKNAISRLENMKGKFDDLIRKVGELNDKNRAANEEIEQLNKKINEIEAAHQNELDQAKSKLVEIKNFQKDNIDNIQYFEKLKPLMEKEPLFKAFLIIEEVGGINLEDLRNALGSPIVLVKKYIQKLNSIGLIKTNVSGKISVKPIEIE